LKILIQLFVLIGIRITLILIMIMRFLLLNNNQKVKWFGKFWWKVSYLNLFFYT